jgi:hypothetical protein
MSLGTRSWPAQGRRQAAASGGVGVLRPVWRRYRRRLLWWSPVALIASAATILLLIAASYQPLRPGGSGAASFPGLRTGSGIRWISKYIPMQYAPERYVPPQRRPFALAASVVNTGSFPVTIVGVSQVPGSPFSAAGPARYLTNPETNQDHPPRHLLHDITLAPGQGIMIGMPLRIAYCASRRSFVGEDVFLVTERFLGFTRTVPMPFVNYGRPVITNARGGQPGAAGMFCSP